MLGMSVNCQCSIHVILTEGTPFTLLRRENIFIVTEDQRSTSEAKKKYTILLRKLFYHISMRNLNLC